MGWVYINTFSCEAMTPLHDYLHPRREGLCFQWGLTGAVGLSLLAHALLLEVVPNAVFTPVTHWEAPAVPEVAYAPKPRQLPEFVEANPAVPENIPDPTTQESARNQQAAQEKPDSLSDAPKPAVEGELEDSPKIVDGSLEEENAMLLPPGLYRQEAREETAEAAEVAVAPPPPLPDFIQQKPVSLEGPGSTLKETGTGRELSESSAPHVVYLNRTGQVAEVREEATSQEVAEAAAARGMPIPQARPKLHFKVPPGKRMKQAVRAGRMGVLAVEARYSEFGDYQQRMIEAVSEQWHLLGSRSNVTGANIQARVVLEFWIDQEGYVHDMEMVESSATRAAALICQDAVLSRAPYGEWPQAMKTVIGERLPMRFLFFYE